MKDDIPNPGTAFSNILKSLIIHYHIALEFRSENQITVKLREADILSSNRIRQFLVRVSDDIVA